MSSRRDRTKRIIEGAVRSCINDHGPIDEKLVKSVTKRIAEQLANAAAHGGAVLHDADQASAVDHLQRRLEKLKHGHRIMLEQYDRCRQERDDLRERLHALDQAEEHICAYCHKPAQGNAFINNDPYCHSDHDEETTCYMLAQGDERV